MGDVTGSPALAYALQMGMAGRLGKSENVWLGHGDLAPEQPSRYRD